MIYRYLLVLLLLFVAACSPAGTSQTSQVLPTVAVIPTTKPDTFNLENAERVARTFLEAWRNNDFTTMHGLLSFAGRDATPLEQFTTVYENAQRTMSLESLDYTITSQILSAGDVMTFNYDVRFSTRLFGDFADNNRTLRLTFDNQASNWRVAWSPGDIFTALGEGGELRYEPRIPSRANIYDSEGNVLADQNARVVILSVIRQNIPAYDECLAGLSAALGKPASELQQTIEARPANWLLELGTIEPAIYIQMNQQLQDDCRAQFSDRPARRYVAGEIVSHIIGHVGYPSEAQIPALQEAGFPQDSIIGQSGIEASWDTTLRGTPGGRLIVAFQNGEQIVLAEGASRPSESLWLTLDMDLQAYIERLLHQDYTRGMWGEGSKGGSAVVMEVNTGKILAMASYPTFDNNAFTPFPTVGRQAADQIVSDVQNDPRLPQLNRATLGIYPAGSIFKVVPAIAATDSGVYTMDHRYNSTGIWQRDIPRRDWLAGGHGLLTVPQFLTYSCNSCFYETGYDLDQVDPFLLPSYARLMGLGSPTGLRDLPEAAGTIIDPDKLAELGGNWRFSDAVNMAIGQGEVEVTPLQMTRLYASIANRGTLYRPYLVEKVGILGEAPSYEAEADPMVDLGVQPDILEMVHQALCTVTTQSGGTAEHIFRDSPLQSIVACGKTGTAQTRGDQLPHAWFIAYAPKDNPQIVVTVMVENSGDGSAVAAPLVRDIMEYYFFGMDSTAVEQVASGG